MSLKETKHIPTKTALQSLMNALGAQTILKPVMSSLQVTPQFHVGTATLH